MTIPLPNFPPFEVHVTDGNAGPRWKKWSTGLERLFMGMGITDKKTKPALLLHIYAGLSVDTLENTGEDKDYKTAIDKLPMKYIQLSSSEAKRGRIFGQLPYMYAFEATREDVQIR